MKNLYVLVISIIVIAGLSNALTAKIGNSLILVPAEVEAGKETIIEKTISIENTNSVAVDVTLRASDEIKNIIEILDSNFAMQKGESKDARFNIKLNKPGEYVGTVWVRISAPNEIPIELPARVVISAKSKGEEALEDKSNNPRGININLRDILQNVRSQKSMIILLSLSTTILSCILLYILYRIKSKKDKKRREQGTLRKIDKNKLNNK